MQRFLFETLTQLFGCVMFLETEGKLTACVTEADLP